jgi:hypothetical protein
MWPDRLNVVERLVVMAGHTERATTVRLPEGQGLATEMAAAAAAVHGTADVRVVTGGAFHSVPAVQQVLADGPTQPRRGGGRISQPPSSCARALS